MIKLALLAATLLVATIGISLAQQSASAGSKLDALVQSVGPEYRTDNPRWNPASRSNSEQGATCTKLSVRERAECDTQRGHYLAECRFTPARGRPALCDQFEHSICESACR